MQSTYQSAALAPLYFQFGKECRWRCCGHICTHIPTALKKKWARENFIQVKISRHFRFQETTEKGTSVRSPAFEGSVCKSSHLWVCVHSGEGGPCILKSKKIERFRKAQMCQRSEGSTYRPYHGKGREGEDSNRKTTAKGKPMRRKEVSE